MSKFVLLASLFATAVLFSFGLTDPNSPVMWLASTTMAFAWLRLIMMVILATLLMTHPPRNIFLRMFIGAFATALAGWSLYSTYNNQMALLDTLVILQFSIASGLIVLESKYLPIETEEERLKSARQARLALSS
jgi:hypothetical protein